MSPQSFGQRVRRAQEEFGPLCVGIDPHRALMEAWGLPYTLEGLRRFTDACVEAFAGHIGVVKPQSAFFEVFGSAGVAVLETAICALRERDTLVILDAKRGDIGTTMEAYAQAFLGPEAIAAPDALTVSPYLGYAALRPAIDQAAATGRGVFVLALTSNPEGAAVQHARYRSGSVAGSIVGGARADNAAARERGELGPVGLVVGATTGNAVADLGLDLAGMGGAILAPGVGAQGGSAEDVKRVFGEAAGNVLPASSREILLTGPDPRALRDRAVQTSASLAALLAGG